MGEGGGGEAARSNTGNRPRIEVLHGGNVACQEQYNIIPMGHNVHSNAKHFYCSWHATWPPCKTSIGIWQRFHFSSYFEKAQKLAVSLSKATRSKPESW